MKITAQLDVTPVQTYYHQLAVVLKQNLERTIRMEAAATVRRAMQLSPPKTLSTKELTLRARESVIKRFNDGPVGGSVNKFTGRRGKKYGGGFAWFVNRVTARVMPIGIVWEGGKIGTPQDHNGQGWRNNDAAWQRWKAAFAKAAAGQQAAASARVGARFLTQKSWYELMLKIASGEPVDAAEAVKRARPVKGISRDVAAAVPNKTPSSFNLTVVNDSGIAVKTSGQRKLNSAISIRRSFFMRSLRDGLYTDAKFVARNYKWATVK